MENIKGMVEVNTIVGDAIETPDGKVIIPISKVSFGFAAGGSDFDIQKNSSETNQQEHPFGGGSGGGVSVQPVAFLVAGGENIRLLTVNNYQIWDRLMDAAPDVLKQVKSMMNNGSCETEDPTNDFQYEYSDSPRDV